MWDITVILGDFAILSLLSRRDSLGDEDILFVHKPDRISPSPTKLSFKSLVQAEFDKDTKLGFVYGTGSGCAFIRKKALEKCLSFAEKKKLRIACLEDLLVIFKKNRLKIKQVDYFDLDFHDIRLIPEDHPSLIAAGGAIEAPPDDVLDRYLEKAIRQGALNMLHGEYLHFGPKF